MKTSMYKELGDPEWEEKKCHLGERGSGTTIKGFLPKGGEMRDPNIKERKKDGGGRSGKEEWYVGGQGEKREMTKDCFVRNERKSRPQV